MENEIKVGEYVRTKDGFIDKIVDIRDTYSGRKLIAFERSNSLKSDIGLKAMVVKHSPNLIDIIELGDCVKLFMEEFIDEGKVEEDTNIFEVIAITTDKKEIGVFTKDFEIEFFPIENIREIYTQEMMESISYKVKE